MNHAKRMVVVPENTLANAQIKQNVETSPLTRKLSLLDNDMEHILQRKDLSDDEKVQLYNQTLQRYLQFYGQRKGEPLSVRVENAPVRSITDVTSVKEDETKPPTENVDDIESEVLDTVPKTLKGKARLILNKIKNNKDIMHWNGKGELIYNKQLVRGTNLQDLVRDSLKGRKTFAPNGWQHFTQGLARMNTPSDWVGNDLRRDFMQEYKRRIDDGDNETDSFMSPPSQPVFKTPPMRSIQHRVRLAPTLSWKTL